MKLTKEQQIELLNESIQQLIQENSELKKEVEELKEYATFSYRDGYDAGYSDAKDYESYE